jgi:uncharacterized RDD family membrane protein YckC
MSEPIYAGFWIRAGASFIDTVLVFVITWPLLSLIYGPHYWESEVFSLGPVDTLISYILPALAVIVFWIYKSATPGKMALKLSIVDAKTGGTPSRIQFIGRYLAYYASAIPFFLGFIWVGIDKRKQGLHDKLAGTVVIRKMAAVSEDKTRLEPVEENTKPRNIQSVERLR